MLLGYNDNLGTSISGVMSLTIEMEGSVEWVMERMLTSEESIKLVMFKGFFYSSLLLSLILSFSFHRKTQRPSQYGSGRLGLADAS